MATHQIDLDTWVRRDTYLMFRGYAKPHYALTVRLDVSALQAAYKSRDVSVYRGCLYAIGAGLHAVDALRLRFRDTQVVRHDTVALSMTVPRPTGGFGYGYVPYHPDFTQFDTEAAARIKAAAQETEHNANSGQRDDLAYLSCLPWLDFSAMDHATPGPDMCIPQISWGKIVKTSDGHHMSMCLQVHHALVDGEDVAGYFNVVQDALDRF